MKIDLVVPIVLKKLNMTKVVGKGTIAIGHLGNPSNLHM